MKYAALWYLPNKVMNSTRSLCKNALDQSDQTKFEIIPPGVNENIFGQTPQVQMIVKQNWISFLG